MTTSATTSDLLRAPSRALAVFATLLLAGLAGCDPFQDECFDGEMRCAGGQLQRCALEDGSGTHLFHSEEDCASEGKTCRDDVGVAACVTDVPCSQSRCDGQTAVFCHASGYVERSVDCATMPGKSCVMGMNSSGCAYADVLCPAGATNFCDADGMTLWQACDADLGHPLLKMTCPAGTTCTPIASAPLLSGCHRP